MRIVAMGLISKLFGRRTSDTSESQDIPITEQARQFADGVDMLLKDTSPGVRPVEALKLVILLGVNQSFKVSEGYIKATEEKDRLNRLFLVQCEFFYFFLHLTNRYFYTTHGEAIGQRWQNEIGSSLVTDFLESIVGHWPQDMKDRIRSDMFQKINDAERDYTQCRGLYPEDKKVFTGNTLFVAVARNVAELAGTMNPIEQFLIMDGAFHIFLRMGFQERVDAAATQLAASTTGNG